MSKPDVVTVRGLRKSYGTRVVVDGLDLDVSAGEIVGLIGANGAGKTTTVECVQGLRKPDGGTLRVLGLDPVPAEDLQRAVRVVAEGGAWLDPAVTGRVLATYRSAPARAAAAGQDTDADLDALTGRELQVLTLIGRGKTNGEIAAELFVSEGTVKTHVNHLFTKLRLRDRAAAVVFAYDHGLADRDD